MVPTRLIETLYALERAREPIEDPIILCEDVANDPEELTGEGVGCVERRAARCSIITGPMPTVC